VDAYLDWALANFSGYVAIDELYDGPFCVLSIVDNRTFKRLIYEVLDHTPKHQDIIAFLRRFQALLKPRNLTLRGVTTDASPLYPEPLRLVFGDVPHQICEFHVLKELNQAILGAVAQVRKSLYAHKPTLKRGRPSGKAAKKHGAEGDRSRERDWCNGEESVYGVRQSASCRPAIQGKWAVLPVPISICRFPMVLVT
jgi:hypothetical protein